MDAKTTVEALMNAVQAGDFAKAKTLMSDDFMFSGPTPQPINADAWMGMSASLKKAFPDLDYHFHVHSVEGDVVQLAAELKGSHHGDLDLTAMGMGMIPATHKSFANPHEHGTATVKDGKVTSWKVESTPGGGVMGILAQIGVKPPGM